MRNLDVETTVVFERGRGPFGVCNPEGIAVHGQIATGCVDHIAVAVVYFDDVDLVIRPNAGQRGQPDRVAGPIISVGIVDSLREELAVLEQGDHGSRQSTFRAKRTENRVVVHADTGDRIGGFESVDDLDQKAVIRSVGQVHDRQGGIDIIGIGVVVARIEQHRGGPDEIAAVQRSTVLEHVGTLTLRRCDIGIVHTKLAAGIPVRRQNGRIGDAHRRLDLNERRPILQ